LQKLLKQIFHGSNTTWRKLKEDREQKYKEIISKEYGKMRENRNNNFNLHEGAMKITGRERGYFLNILKLLDKPTYLETTKEEVLYLCNTCDSEIIKGKVMLHFSQSHSENYITLKTLIQKYSTFLYIPWSLFSCPKRKYLSD